MYFRITADTVELIEPENVASFSVVCPSDLGENDVAAAVARADLGELLPGADHVLVKVDAIRRFAGGHVGAGWEADLARMLAYAESKGWTSGDGASVRAHIEKETT